MRRSAVRFILALGCGAVAGCAATQVGTLTEAAAHPDRRYALTTAADTIIVDSLRLVGDSVVARRSPIRPDLVGEEVRLAAADVRTIAETHPDQVGLGLTVLAMAPLLIFSLIFALGYGSD